MQKKVVFVNLRLTGGGSEKVMSMLASYYAEAGVDTTMLLLQERERTFPVSDQVKLVECYCPMRGNKILWHIRRIYKLRKALRSIEADTVISFMWDVNMRVLLASIGLGKRVIISERADPNNVSRPGSLRFAQKWVFPRADRIVFQTPQVMAAYPEKLQSKGVVIPNPIPNFEPSKERGSEKSIVAAGRLLQQKNFSMLIKAFALFHKAHQDYTLKIYGEGSEREKLTNLAAELGVADSVFLPGFVSDVRQRMESAAIYASSSDFEGISNAMLEALTIGIPSVCTDCPVGGAAMAITDHVNGILVNVGDAEAMANAFAEIADDDVFAGRLSAEAVRMSRAYSLESIAGKWMNL